MTKYNTNFHETYPFSDTAPQFALAANTVLTYTVPGNSNNQYRVDFSWPVTANVWVGLNTTPVVPTAGTMSPNNRTERNPFRKYARGGDVLSFISDTIVTNAGMVLFQLPSM